MNSLRCLTQLTVNDSLKSMYLYTDPILTAAKKHRCRCEGVCNEWGDKWFTSTSKVSAEGETCS